MIITSTIILVILVLLILRKVNFWIDTVVVLFFNDKIFELIDKFSHTAWKMIYVKSIGVRIANNVAPNDTEMRQIKSDFIHIFTDVSGSFYYSLFVRAFGDEQSLYTHLAFIFEERYLTVALKDKNERISQIKTYKKRK